MAFSDNLYNIGNIIGYTGDLHDFPTVYFQCDRLQLAGHITQRHEYSQNVGRHDPFPTIGYSIRNVVDRTTGRLVAKEYFYAFAFHTSRSTFKRLGTQVRNGRGAWFDIGTVNILTQAIRRYPHEKQMSTIGDRDRQRINDVKRDKAAVMDQLKQLNMISGRGHIAMQRRGLV